MFSILIGCFVTALLANAEDYQYTTSTGQYPQQQQRSQQTENEQPHHILADPRIVNSYTDSYKETFGELNIGRNYFEGDIILTQQQSDFITRSLADDNTLQARAIVKDVRKLWKNREVPYVIGDDLRDESKDFVKSAVEEWKEKTCMKVRPKTDSDTDYIEFVYDGGCSSYVGRVGGRQTISVGSADGSVTCRHGNIVHELAHSLGYFHEHSRPDRDKYIKVVWDNVMNGYEKNFRKETVSTVDSRGVGYDYDSVMHYGAFFFATNKGDKTIETKEEGASIGQRVGLSDLDVKQARLLYNCDGDFDEPRSNTQYYDTMKRTHIKKDKKEQNHSIKKSFTNKKAHLRNAVKNYVQKMNSKKKISTKTKITGVKKNNMGGLPENTMLPNTQPSLQPQDTQQAIQSQNTQQPLQSIDTQQTAEPENTMQVTVPAVTQQALQPLNTQQAAGSANAQQAGGNPGTNEGGKPEIVVTDDDLAEENLGMNYFEGDMILTDEQRQYLEGLKDDNPAAKRALIKNSTFLWPQRTVYYTFDDSVDEIGRKNAENAISHWQDKTCLKFKKRDGEKDYINFVFEGGCASRVGRGGGMQKLTIGSTELRCKKGNIIHEVGHALGFFHEHSRPDRDEYVEVLRKNIMPGYERNFFKFSTTFIDSRNVPYDYGSIMQYGRNFFSKLSLLLPTMETKKKSSDGKDIEIGQRVALSDMDILQANLLYGCDGRKRLTDEQREDLEGDYEDPMTGQCGDSYDSNSCLAVKSLGYCERYPRTLRSACGQTCQLCSLHQRHMLPYQGAVCRSNSTKLS